MRSASTATYLSIMPEIVPNPIKRILSIESQIEGEMQVEKKANKKALIKTNHDNTPIMEHTKQCQTKMMTLTQNFLYLV